eukprot:TRINITY_DN3903_c0_g1_i1.p1 TRINITY_DN3903_c0_g1~~TRINITY_DN3903_c0_g1_i1.p1  ORF type:complete len:113 (-),score=16.48 TRINITY_DN3903_c0_g1_i1:60-398(-)
MDTSTPTRLTNIGELASRKRKYFDSADWMLTGEVRSVNPRLLSKPTPTKVDVKDKYGICSESDRINSVIAKRLLLDRPKRIYFDSADWALYGKGKKLQQKPHPKLGLGKNNL